MKNDNLLEQAIASYSNAEPSSGFSQRVLDRSTAARRKWLWAAIPVFAAAAGVYIGVVHFSHPPQVREIRTAAVLQVSRAEPLQPLKQTGRPLRRHPVRQAAPQLTKQEQALVRWIERSPETAGAEWLAMEEHLQAPIEIRVLEVKPLAIQEISQ